MNTWLPWIGVWIGITVGGGVLLGAYLLGEKRGWWW
jgi:hypothetical protein